VPNCFLRAHITILPPRPITTLAEVAWNQLRPAAEHFHAFDIELSQVEVFPSTEVIYISAGKGEEQLRAMHKALNTGGVEFKERYAYHPHVTLAQDLKPDELDELICVARRRWEEYTLGRAFHVDTLAFVQSTRYTTWIDLASCRLKEDSGLGHVYQAGD